MSNEEKSRYSDEELKEFDVLLIEKLQKAKEHLDLYTRQINDTGENSDSKVKGLDNAVGGMETERLIILASRQGKHIQHLENARLRIENKVYGICRVTKKLISKERLKAVPHATLSIEAKQA